MAVGLLSKIFKKTSTPVNLWSELYVTLQALTVEARQGNMSRSLEDKAIDLIMQGAPLDRAILDDRPQYWAAHYANPRILKALIAKKADMTITSQLYDNLLGILAKSDHESPLKQETAEILLAAGVDPNGRNLYGRTPLSEAIKSDDLIVAHELLKAGASVMISDNFGHTAQYYAARSAQPFVTLSSWPKDPQPLQKAVKPSGIATTQDIEALPRISLPLRGRKTL